MSRVVVVDGSLGRHRSGGGPGLRATGRPGGVARPRRGRVGAAPPPTCARPAARPTSSGSTSPIRWPSPTWPTRSRPSVGPIDVWVNVAFTSVFAPFHEIEPDEYRRVTEVSYLGYVYGTMAALRHMRPRDRGVIVQVGSALAYRGIPLQSAYCGAKHAIQGFNESLRCELLHAKSGIHDDGADAGGQHPAVLLGALPAAAPCPAGAADLPARGRRRGGGVRRRSPPAARVLGGFETRPHAGGQRRGAGAAGPLSRPHRIRRRSRPMNRGDPDAPVNLWSPADGPDGRDFGAHGVFDAKSISRDPQLLGLAPSRPAADGGGGGGRRRDRPVAPEMSRAVRPWRAGRRRGADGRRRGVAGLAAGPGGPGRRPERGYCACAGVPAAGRAAAGPGRHRSRPDRAGRSPRVGAAVDLSHAPEHGPGRGDWPRYRRSAAISAALALALVAVEAVTVCGLPDRATAVDRARPARLRAARRRRAGSADRAPR